MNLSSLKKLMFVLAVGFIVLAVLEFSPVHGANIIVHFKEECSQPPKNSPKKPDAASTTVASATPAPVAPPAAGTRKKRDAEGGAKICNYTAGLDCQYPLPNSTAGTCLKIAGFDCADGTDCYGGYCPNKKCLPQPSFGNVILLDLFVVAVTSGVMILGAAFEEFLNELLNFYFPREQ